MAILSLLLGVLPGFLLQGLQAYLQATTTQAMEGEKTRRQVLLATVTGIVQIRQAQAAVIQAGMQHGWFWVAWLTAALPMSAWFGWGMLDTLMNGALPDVASIPPGLKPYADQVWDNIFLPGSIAATGLAVAGAIVRRK